MKKNYKTIISIIVSLVLLGLVFVFINPTEIITGFQRISLWKFAIVLGITTITQLLTAYRWHIILKALKIKLPFRGTFLARLGGHAVSFFTPIAEFGGAPARAYCIKERQGSSFSKSLTSAIIDNLLELIVQMVFISGTLLYFYYRFELPLKLDFIITGIVVFAALVFIFTIRMTKGRGIVEKFFDFIERTASDETSTFPYLKEKMKEGERLALDLFSNQKKVIAQGIGLGVLTYSSSILEVWVLTSFMGFNFTLLQVLIIKVVMNITFIIPLPAGLGASEWGQAGYFRLIKAGGGSGIAFSLLFKAKNAIFALFGAIYLAYRGILTFTGIHRKEETS